MEETVTRKSRSALWKWLLGTIALIIFALILVFANNRSTLSLELRGEPEMILEYGAPYEDPGVDPILCGTLLYKDGRTLEDANLHIEGSVDSNKLGKYTLTYSASYRNLSAIAQRTVRVVDTESPVITLVSDSEPKPGTQYIEEGFTAVDNYDGDITHRVIRTESLGLVTYTVLDSSGNPAYVEREIPYFDAIPPVITLTAGEYYTIPTGIPYTEPGFSAQDNADGDVTSLVSAEGAVDCYTPGKYPITYTVTDSNGNQASITRTVEVVAQPRPETVYPQGKTVYLTFDDGPGPYTMELLDVLDKYDVKATFFVTDTGWYDVMREIVDRGHSIGIHTVTHRYEEIYESPEAYFRDLYGMQDIIYRETGVKTTLMRFPGGSSNSISRDLYPGLMTLLSEAVQDAGFQYFDWNVDSNDAGGARKAKTVVENVTAGLQECPVAIVLQHDIHSYSVEAVEDIILWALDNGYTFQPLTPNSPGCHHGLNN